MEKKQIVIFQPGKVWKKKNNFPDLVGGHTFSYILFKIVIILLVSS